MVWFFLQRYLYSANQQYALTHESVSYTHLDVYKRQVLQGLRWSIAGSSLRLGENTPPGSQATLWLHLVLMKWL